MLTKRGMKTERNIANIYFLLLMLLMWGINFLPIDILGVIVDNLVLNSVISELLIAAPALLMAGIWYVIQSHKAASTEGYEAVPLSDRLMYRAVKPSTILMTFVYTLMIMPVITLCNVITMQFVDNTILELSGDILDMSIPTAIFTMAVLPPFCEELAFRGVVYGGYRRACRPLASVLMSALLFGLMHGNINQFAYAFVIGIAMALLVEATGSIWPSVLMHALINSRTVLAMFVLDHLYTGLFEELLEGDMKEAVGSTSALTVIVYVLLSVITLLMAGGIISWISGNEGRTNPLKSIRNNKLFKEKRITVWSVSLVLGILAAVALVIITEMLT